MDIPDYKKRTIQVYDDNIEDYERINKDFIKQYLLEETTYFLSHLPGKKILDLGSGPGDHALYFNSKGFDTLCIDLSPKMIQRCKQKGLVTIMADIENVPPLPHQFDGIWAYQSLIHVPRAKLPGLFRTYQHLLNDHG